MNDYQKAQREKTIAAAIEAATLLQQKGVTLTFRAIAEEAGYSHATILQPAVKIALYERFQIGKGKKGEVQHDSKLQARIEELEKSLAKSRKVNSTLRTQCKLLKEERDKIDVKYRQLLLRYAIDIDKKIQPL